MRKKKETSFMINFHCHQLWPLCWSKENNLPNEQGFVGSLYDQKMAFVADKEGFVGKDHEGGTEDDG